LSSKIKIAYQHFKVMSESQRRPFSLEPDPLPELISQNIEAIVALHTNAERNLSRHQRWVETATHFFSRPAFLYLIIVIVLLWTLANIAPEQLNLPQFDPPPFGELGFAMSFGSLLMTVGLLIQQGRQEKLAEQRNQLSLQLSLLSEQKIAKLIALIEELRRDLPSVHDRVDSEAEIMQQATDPQQVLDVLEEVLLEELIEIQKQPA
jgi:uncharacterized membrane protein